MSYLTPHSRPLRRQNVYTFQDAFVRVLDAMSVSTDGRHGRMARQACQEAWIELPSLHDWSYLYRTSGLVTTTPYSTGTIAYTHSTRTVTLTGGTWPSDMLQRVLFIANQSYVPERVASSTSLILREEYNPGEDLAAETEYTAYKSQYLIPVEFSRVGQLRSQNNASPQFVTPQQMDEYKRYLTGGTPIYYTIRGSQSVIGAYVIEFCPAPTVAEKYEFPYESKLRPMRTWTSGQCEYNTGTISVASTTVTGTGTAFTSDMVGCVLRVSDSTTVCPTGLVGGPYYGGTSTDNPYTEYRMITAYSSATSITIDEAFTGTYSAVKYTIGDPIDLPEEVYLLFLRAAERRYVQSIPITERLSLKESEFRRQLTTAQIADSKIARPVNSNTWVDLRTLMDNAPPVE